MFCQLDQWRRFVERLLSWVVILVIFEFVFLSNCLSSLAQTTNGNLGSFEFDRAAVFDEVTTKVEKEFFDRDFDVAAWQTRAAKFREQAISAESLDQFSKVVNSLLSTLNASHTRYFSKLDPRRYQLLGVFSQLYPNDNSDLFIYDGIGIYTQTIQDADFITSVIDGFPAFEAGLQFGDQILAVDGKPFHPMLSFSGKAGSNVSVQIRRNGIEKVVQVKVAKLDGRDMFEKALEASKRVIEKNGKKIGYLHAWSYAGSKYQEMIRSSIIWGELSQCDALILDLRDGWGGADLNYLNLFRKPILEIDSFPRSGPPNNYTGVWGKPVALITNGGSTSGKELFTFGFKKLGLGKVFGERTAGAVVAGRCFLLSNRDVLYLAVHDIRVDGVRLEGRGVTPDVVVPRPVKGAAEMDPQLNRVIEYFATED